MENDVRTLTWQQPIWCYMNLPTDFQVSFLSSILEKSKHGNKWIWVNPASASLFKCAIPAESYPNMACILSVVASMHILIWMLHNATTFELTKHDNWTRGTVYLLCKCQVTSSYNRVNSLIWYAGWEHAHIRKFTNTWCMDAKIDELMRSPISSQLSLRNKSIICTWNLWCAAHKWQCHWNIQVLASHLQVLPSLLGQFAHPPCQLWEIVLHWQRACTVHIVLLNPKKKGVATFANVAENKQQVILLVMMSTR